MLLNCLAKQIRALPSTFTVACRMSSVATENAEFSKCNSFICIFLVLSVFKQL